MLNISHRTQKVHIVQRTGIESVLPEVSRAAVHAVYVLRIDQVRSPDGFGERIFAPGPDDDMDVVGHKAIAQNLKGEFFRLFAQQPQVHSAVVVNEEYVLPVVAALGDMVR